MTNSLDEQLKELYIAALTETGWGIEEDGKKWAKKAKALILHREAEARKDEKEKIWTWVQENNDTKIAERAAVETEKRFDGWTHIVWLAMEGAIKSTKTRDELVGQLYGMMNEKKAELERRHDG